MSQVRQAVGEALWAACAADAMSMPAHWYYNVRDIWDDFGGWISCFRAPKTKHPSSILSLSNTAGSGRSASSSVARQPEVVGNVILHDKLGLWKSSSSCVHYHQGLQEGHNTLNMLCALRAARVLTGFADVSRQEARGAVLEDYVRFMTTPGSHNDTYAESSHRAFFADWQKDRPATAPQVLQFAESRSQERLRSSYADSQLDAIGCLLAALPFILLSASANEDQAVSAAVEFVKLTHPHPGVAEHVSLYGRSLHAVLGGADLRRQAEEALKKLGVWEVCQKYGARAAAFPRASEGRLRVHQSAVRHLGIACYTEGALSSMFYLAHEFHDDLEEGILTNTNCGGENCNRGAALGALLGPGGSYHAAAAAAAAVPQRWREKLKDGKEAVPDILRRLRI